MANINDYYIGKGVVSFRKDGESGFRDVGNVPVFEFTPEITELEHFSSREGVRTNDRTVTLQKSATVRMVMEEWTAENLALALIGDVGSDGSGRDEIDILSGSQVEGELMFVGSNDVGRQFTVVLNAVSFRPNASLNFISEEWGQIEVTGRCSAVSGSFGTMTDNTGSV